MPKSVSIYDLSKLAYTDPVAFHRTIEEMQAGRGYRSVNYKPARETVRRYHASDHDDKILIEAIGKLRAKEAAATGRDVAQPKHNAEVLEAYRNSFTCPFRPKTGSVPGEFSTLSVERFGLKISGKPHLAVENCQGTTKYLFLLTSAGDTTEEKRLRVTLLTEIVLENYPSAAAKDVEGLDCRTGRKVKGLPLGGHLLNRMQTLAELLRKFDLA